ncbi:MAG: hypothetical protein K0M49_13325 [Arenimonas sp.]|nr:hypothetical protein [Rhizobium sp.]MBW8446604.1 hypothetical protein [Arenimonas sp.]
MAEEMRSLSRTLPDIGEFGYHRGMNEKRNEFGQAAEADETAEAGEGTGDAVIGNPGGRLRHADVAAAQRKARAAMKLRENLMRRKQQQRSRRHGEADDTEGLPAAKSPDRDD